MKPVLAGVCLFANADHSGLVGIAVGLSYRPVARAPENPRFARSTTWA